MKSVYYHNNSEHIYGDNIKDRINVKQQKYHGLTTILYEENGSIIYDGSILKRNRWDYNLSSIALKKQWIQNYFVPISAMNVRYIDTFIAFAALYSSNQLILDDETSTFTRVHNSNASMFIERPSSTERIKIYSKDMEGFISALNICGLQDKLEVKNYILIRGLDDRMKCMSIKKTDCALELLKIMKIHGIGTLKSDVGLKAVAYTISPSLMNFMLKFFHST